MRLPRGCRFRPEPSELIEYLQDKVEGRPDACQGVIIDNVDVYGCSPVQLLDMVGGLILHDDGRLFFFTSIKHRNGNCRDRSTPDGHWKSTKKTIEIRNGEGRLVGYRQEFCYFHGKKEPKRTKWLMKEYTLDHEQPKMALCVIYSAQSRGKDQIQGNECRIQPLKHQQPMDSESEDTRHHYSSNDWSSLGNATEDERHRYLKLVTEKTGESYDKILLMAPNVGMIAAQKFSKPEQRAGPSGGGFLSSSSGFLSAPATIAGYLSGCDGYTRCNSAADVSDRAPDSLDLDALSALDVPSQESPTAHADAAFREGGSAEAAAYPGMLPDTDVPEMWQESFIFGHGEVDGLFNNFPDLFT